MSSVLPGKDSSTKRNEQRNYGAIQSLSLSWSCWPEEPHAFFMFSTWKMYGLCVVGCAVSTYLIWELCFPTFLAWVRFELARNRTYMRFERQKKDRDHYFLKVFLGSCVVTDGQMSSLCSASSSWNHWPCWLTAAPGLPPDTGLQATGGACKSFCRSLHSPTSRSPFSCWDGLTPLFD